MNIKDKRNIEGFCLASFCSDWCHEMGTALLPAFITQLVGIAYAPTMLGVVQGVSDGAATVARLIAGYIADYAHFYKSFLVIGYGIMGISIALIGTAETIWTILLYKCIAWIMRGMREPIRDTWLSKIVLSHMYGRIFGLQRAWDTLGALFGPLTVFFLLRQGYSLSFIFFCALIPGLMSMIPIIVLTTEKEEQISRKGTISYRNQLAQLPLSFTYFLIVMLLFGCANFHHTFLLYRVQELFSGVHALSVVGTLDSVGLYAFFNIARGISEWGIGLLSDYINRKKLLIFVGFGLFAVVSICCMSNSTTLWFWVMVFGFAGMSTGTVKVLEKAYAAYILPEHVRGTGLGLLQATDGVGDLVSSTVVGFLWAFYSPAVALTYAAGLSCVAMVVFVVKRDE